MLLGKTLNLSRVVNTTFYICSVTWPLDGSEAGVDLVLIQSSLLLLSVKQDALMLTRCIYMPKAVRSVSKQGQLQPHSHSKARSLSRQL